MTHPLRFFDTYQKKLISLNENDTITPKNITIYRCGPTIYSYQHAGNAVGAFLTDLIVNTGRLSGWKVKHVENITDVGHLVGDGDYGEDKLEVGAKRDGLKVSEVVEKYLSNYKEQLSLLNITLPEGKNNPKATEFILEQFTLAIELLIQKKAYLAIDGIYFDSQANADLISVINDLPGMPSSEGDRDFTGRDITSKQRHPEDFALWKFVIPETLQKWKISDFSELKEYTSTQLDHETVAKLEHWGSPGWHSECVTMISQILGNKRFSLNGDTDNNTAYEIDIHIGGEDHIPVHHRNEILQSEALGIHLSKHWLHNKFLLMDSKKMSKSIGNIFLVHGDPAETGFESLTNKGFDPLSFRLMLFEHHYSDQINFTWDKLTQSQNRLHNLRKTAALVRGSQTEADQKEHQQQPAYQEMLSTLRDNLNTPKFLEIFTDTLDSAVDNPEIIPSLMHIDASVLKLDLFPDIPQDIQLLAEQRKDAKQSKDYQLSDEIRDNLKSQGWVIDDHAQGYSLWKL